MYNQALLGDLELELELLAAVNTLNGTRVSAEVSKVLLSDHPMVKHGRKIHHLLW